MNLGEYYTIGDMMKCILVWLNGVMWVMGQLIAITKSLMKSIIHNGLAQQFAIFHIECIQFQFRRSECIQCALVNWLPSWSVQCSYVKCQSSHNAIYSHIRQTKHMWVIIIRSIEIAHHACFTLKSLSHFDLVALVI